MSLPNCVRVGYGPYKTKQELEDAESKAWLAIPIEERLEIVKRDSAEYDTKEKRKRYIEKLKREFNAK